MGRPKCHSRPLGQSDELCIMVHFVFMMHSHWVSARGVLSVANIPSTFRFVLFVCSCGRERASGSGHPPSPSSASRRVPDVYTRLIYVSPSRIQDGHGPDSTNKEQLDVGFAFECSRSRAARQPGRLTTTTDTGQFRRGRGRQPPRWSSRCSCHFGRRRLPHRSSLQTVAGQITSAAQ